MIPDRTSQRLFLVGRLPGLTRRRLAALARSAGFALATRPGAHVTAVALAHGSAREVLSDRPGAGLPEPLPYDVELVSELELRRRLGIEKPSPAGDVRRDGGDLDAESVRRLSRLDENAFRWLSAYDVLEPRGGRYDFRDLVAAREAARLLAGGASLEAVVTAALALRRHGLALCDARLVESPAGEILRDIAGRLSELGGQYRLPLDAPPLGSDEAFARAEAAEAAGRLLEAERWYRIALTLDRSDPVIPFNLGNVLDGLGQADAALVAWRMALARDGAFADAWFNLGVALERAGTLDLAVRHYSGALQADACYADAAYNLALLLTKLGRYGDAAPAWERFLALEPRSAATAAARRYAALCRLQVAEPGA